MAKAWLHQAIVDTARAFGRVESTARDPSPRSLAASQRGIRWRTGAGVGGPPGVPRRGVQRRRGAAPRSRAVAISRLSRRSGNREDRDKDRGAHREGKRSNAARRVPRPQAQGAQAPQARLGDQAAEPSIRAMVGQFWCGHDTSWLRLVKTWARTPRFARRSGPSARSGGGFLGAICAMPPFRRTAVTRGLCQSQPPHACGRLQTALQSG